MTAAGSPAARPRVTADCPSGRTASRFAPRTGPATPTRLRRAGHGPSPRRSLTSPATAGPRRPCSGPRPASGGSTASVPSLGRRRRHSRAGRLQRRRPGRDRPCSGPRPASGGSPASAPCAGARRRHSRAGRLQRRRPADTAVFRPSTGVWWIPGLGAVRWGEDGDIPVPADYNGDGRAEMAVFRPSTGAWWIPGLGAVRWGEDGDIPAYNAQVECGCAMHGWSWQALRDRHKTRGEGRATAPSLVAVSSEPARAPRGRAYGAAPTRSRPPRRCDVRLRLS